MIFLHPPKKTSKEAMRHFLEKYDLENIKRVSDGIGTLIMSNDDKYLHRVLLKSLFRSLRKTIKFNSE